MPSGKLELTVSSLQVHMGFRLSCSNTNICIICYAGVVSTFAGKSLGSVNGFGTNAKFYYPSGITVDTTGNVYVADYYNYQTRKITSAGICIIPSCLIVG